MPGAATPLSNHAAGFDYLLSQSPSQAQPTPHGTLSCTTQLCACQQLLHLFHFVVAGVGLWGGFDVLPLHRPAIADSSRHGPTSIPTAAHRHLLPDRHVHPLHAPQPEPHARNLMLGGSTDTSTKGRAGAVIYEDSTNQNQLLKDSRPDQLHLSSEPDGPAGNCPPIKFGVFTNLVSGSKFAAPSKLSAAAQQKMRSFASEEAPLVLADDANISLPADQQGLGRETGQPMSTSSGQLLGRQLRQPMGRPVDQSMGRRIEETTHDITGPAQPEGSCPQVKFGVLTNLKTGGSFAAPSKWSAERLKGIFQDEPSDLENLPRDTPLSQPQQQQQPRESAELVAADLVNRARQESAGACPQIEFGVFTNLKTGGNFAAPSKLSAAAQQKAKDILHEDTVGSQLPAQHDSPQHPQQQPTGPPGQKTADVSNPASTLPEGSNSQVQPGVFTNLKAGGSFAPPSQLSATAQQRFSKTSVEEAIVPPDHQTSNAQPQSHLPAGLASEHTTAASSKASSTTAGDLCPQVDFGVFTNLRTGGSFAAPRTLSAAAQQKAREFHPEHATAPENEGTESDLQMDTDATQALDQMQPSSRQQPTSPHVQPPCPEQEQVPHKGIEPQVPAAADSVNQQETEAAQQAAPLPDPHGSAAADTAAADTAGLTQAQLSAQAHAPHAASVGTLEDASSADNAMPPASATAASPAAGSAEAQARHSGSKWRRPPTALSRLSKLARSSPGIALPQRASAQQVQHTPAVPAPAAAAVGVHTAEGNMDASGLADTPDVAKQQSHEEQCTQPQQQEACLAKQLPPEDMQHVQMQAAGSVHEPVSGLTAAAAASLAEPGRSARNWPS